MKYHIKYNGGEMLILSDDAFKGFIKVAVVYNKDIKDFHVTSYNDDEDVFKVVYKNGEVRYFNRSDFAKLIASKEKIKSVTSL